MEAVQLINFPGEIFLQVLKLMILPLIFSSLVAGECERRHFESIIGDSPALAQLDAKAAGQLGLLTVGYYATTTILSTIVGANAFIFVRLLDVCSLLLDRHHSRNDDSSRPSVDHHLNDLRNTRAYGRFAARHVSRRYSQHVGGRSATRRKSRRFLASKSARKNERQFACRFPGERR